MTQRGNSNSKPILADLACLTHSATQSGPIIQGKSYLNPPVVNGNLAVQQSLMEIFDEFTPVISGELKSFELESCHSERLVSTEQSDHSAHW